MNTRLAWYSNGRFVSGIWVVVWKPDWKNPVHCPKCPVFECVSEWFAYSPVNQLSTNNVGSDTYCVTTWTEWSAKSRDLTIWIRTPVVSGIQVLGIQMVTSLTTQNRFIPGQCRVLSEDVVHVFDAQFWCKAIVVTSSIPKLWASVSSFVQRNRHSWLPYVC